MSNDESIEYEVVQDGCVQFASPSFHEADAWAHAEGPWALSIYRNHRTLVSKLGKPVRGHLGSTPDGGIDDHDEDATPEQAYAEGRKDEREALQPVIEALKELLSDWYSFAGSQPQNDAIEALEWGAFQKVRAALSKVGE